LQPRKQQDDNADYERTGRSDCSEGGRLQNINERWRGERTFDWNPADPNSSGADQRRTN
jgi:hypothetical protein